MTRFARSQSVIYFEEPVMVGEADVHLEVRREPSGVQVLVPHVQAEHAVAQQRQLLDHYMSAEPSTTLTLWYYTPMSLAFSAHLRAEHTVYDCMDELSAFRFCPPELVDRERELMDRADVVFTGGNSLYEVKRTLHPNAHAFPSSVDIEHFATARAGLSEPSDMDGMPHPRLGFYGVIDERFDVALLAQLSAARPQWQFVMIGPIVKIDPVTLPHAPNLHYLGSRGYDDLPAYLAHWDVALMPFALNEATRFISPTKTPEYLAGGCPVVSTPIADVVSGYGRCEAVRIAGTAGEFEAAIESFLTGPVGRSRLHAQADAFLCDLSWDKTFNGMRRAIAAST
ncbi:glycosyltransferase family 1 protein [soil metagenome]